MSTIDFETDKYLIVAIGAFILSFSSAPIFRRVAVRFNLTDNPNLRKLQPTPVPYLGGLAILLPISIGSIFLPFFENSGFILGQYFLGIFLPGLFIAILGLLDDAYELRILPRLLCQIAVGNLTSLFLILSGGGIQLFEFTWINFIFTTLWVVSIINAINFMDNMDGLVTSLSLIISITFCILSILNGQSLVALFCLVIAASTAGFLFWNFQPATIYLGDMGALYLGFLLAAVSIRIDINSQSIASRIAVPILILALPLLDLFRVVVTRIVSRKSPFIGGRDHISHKLLAKNFSVNKVLIILCGFQFLLSSIGIFIYLNTV